MREATGWNKPGKLRYGKLRRYNLDDIRTDGVSRNEKRPNTISGLAVEAENLHLKIESL